MLMRRRTAHRIALSCAAVVLAGCGGDVPRGPQAKATPCPGFEYAPRDGFPIAAGSGDLAKAVSTYVSAIKGANSGDYRPPSLDERTDFAKSWTEFVDLPTKRSSLDAFGYDVFLYDDTGPGAPSGSRWTIACERRNAEGTWDRGWGLYLSNARGINAITEVPHPKFDQHSADVGVAIARRTGGQLLIAGAHRDANGEFSDDGCIMEARCSDMSHQPRSVFQAVHDTLINPPECQENPRICKVRFAVVQPHGFATSAHQGIGHIALSDGTPTPFTPSLISDLASDLEADGFDVCRYQAPGDCRGTTSDGSPGTSLGATRNVQGMSSRDAVVPVAFLHLEIAREVRDKATGSLSRMRVASVVASRLRDVGSG